MAAGKADEAALLAQESVDHPADGYFSPKNRLPLSTDGICIYNKMKMSNKSEFAEAYMEYRIMEETDICKAVSLYMDYYNVYEDGAWTEETTHKRIHQVLSREDSYCMVLEEESELIAFAMGYFEQYDDCFAYDLVEIVVSSEKQNQGIGTMFMIELERRVKEKGAMLIQLQAVNDGLHEHFYGKLGYNNAANLVLKTKIL